MARMDKELFGMLVTSAEMVNYERRTDGVGKAYSQGYHNGLLRAYVLLTDSYYEDVHEEIQNALQARAEIRAQNEEG